MVGAHTQVQCVKLTQGIEAAVHIMLLSKTLKHQHAPQTTHPHNQDPGHTNTLT